MSLRRRSGSATVALGSGVPAKVASEVLGHSSVTVTLDTYGHAFPGMHEAATQAVAERIFGTRWNSVRTTATSAADAKRLTERFRWSACVSEGGLEPPRPLGH